MFKCVSALLELHHYKFTWFLFFYYYYFFELGFFINLSWIIHQNEAAALPADGTSLPLLCPLLLLREPEVAVARYHLQDLEMC